jgi:DNA-binding transcriptional regulator LsrR (DeoR family)
VALQYSPVSLGMDAMARFWLRRTIDDILDLAMGAGVVSVKVSRVDDLSTLFPCSSLATSLEERLGLRRGVIKSKVKRVKSRSVVNQWF